MWREDGEEEEDDGNGMEAMDVFLGVWKFGAVFSAARLYMLSGGLILCFFVYGSVGVCVFGIFWVELVSITRPL